MPLQNIFPINELTTLARARSRPYQTKSVHPKLVEEAEAEGWQVIKSGKVATRLQRPKPIGVSLEDRVWTLLFRMQFEFLSGAGGARLLLDFRNKEGPTNQLDVVGIDSELVLAIECKSSEKYAKRPQFQEELAKLASFKERISKAVTTLWPGSHKRQTALLFFSYNINLSDNDRERAKQANVFLFDEKDLERRPPVFSSTGL